MTKFLYNQMVFTITRKELMMILTYLKMRMLQGTRTCKTNNHKQSIIRNNKLNLLMKWMKKLITILDDQKLHTILLQNFLSFIWMLISSQFYNLIMISRYSCAIKINTLLARSVPFINSSYFFFSSNDNKNNSKQNKNNNDELNQDKPKKSFRVGYNLPLYVALRQRLRASNKRRHQLQDKLRDKQIQNKLFQKLQKLATQKQNQANKKQKQEEQDKKDNQKQKQNNKDEKQNKNNKQSGSRIKNYLFIGLFLLLLSQLSGQNEPTKKKDQKKNIQFVLQQIRSSVQPCRITVQNIRFLQIQVIIQIGKAKKYSMKLSEKQLILLLEELEKINNVKVEVQFLPSDNVNFKAGAIDKFIARLFAFSLAAVLAFFLYKSWGAAKKMGNMDPMSILNTKKFQPVKPQNITTLFKDVAGMHQAKFQITQFVDFLKKPDKYIQMGAKVPKGALLTGPPGTGKTLLAKACAGQAGVPFFSVSGSDFVQRYSGLGATRVRQLFDQAQKVAPSIIFIDQIDAIGKKRDAGPFSNEQRDNTLNQLLVRMDGFDTKQKVIVMAATNRKDMLDPALLRPGRFDRSVEIGLPNFQQRAEILKVHLKKIKYDNKLTEQQLAKKIARITPGFSGAQLANTCNQAAIMAARQNIQLVTLKNFQKATERVMAGLEKRNIFSEQQKQLLAFYESGKAVVNWFTQGADPVIKISILPFSKSKAGYSHSIKDQTALHTKQQLLSKVCCYLAGRSSENHFKGCVSTHGDNDLKRAKNIITMIVTKFGMSQSLKMLAFPDFDFVRKPYSEKTEMQIDTQILKLTQQCQKKVEQIIKQKQQLILKLQQKLIEKQTLNHNEIKQILGERPFGGSETYNDYLKDQKQEQAPKHGQQPRAGVAAG